MSHQREWHTVESDVYTPGRWLFVTVGTAFLLIGLLGSAFVQGEMQGRQLLLATLLFAVFALCGSGTLAWIVYRIYLPARIRHAPLDVLPNVPREPVLVEGSMVHGRVTHELVEEPDQWLFRPEPGLWHKSQRFLLGFGIPFMTLFAGILSWDFHANRHLGWPTSILGGVTITVVAGGVVFGSIGMMIHAAYRRLSFLTIPRNGADLEIDSPEPPDVGQMDLTAGLEWGLLGRTGRRRANIPRDVVVAVQLCPWKFVVGRSHGSSTTWGVQGLLVLACPEKNAYDRLPLMLTSDFIGAARLMQSLAVTLNVPYLYCADAEGWSAEEDRARTRPPLQVGGSLS